MASGSGGANSAYPLFKAGEVISGGDLTAVSRQAYRANAINRSSGSAHIQNANGDCEVPAPSDGDILFWNGAETTIPAFGIALLNGAQTIADTCFYKAKLPDTYGCQCNWILNGGTPLPSTTLGLAQSVFGGGCMPGLPGFIAAYDPADGTPSAGDRVGPRANTFLLKAKTGGFVVQGIYDSTNNLVLVVPEPMVSFRGKPSNGSVPANTFNFSVDIWWGSYGSETIVTGQTMPNCNNCTSCQISTAKVSTWVMDPSAQVANSSPIWQASIFNNG